MSKFQAQFRKCKRDNWSKYAETMNDFRLSKEMTKITWLIERQTSHVIFPSGARTFCGLNCEHGRRNLNLPMQSTETSSSLCYEAGWSRFEKMAFRIRSVKHKTVIFGVNLNLLKHEAWTAGPFKTGPIDCPLNISTVLPT